jgi:hypothetical protein
MGRRKGKEFIYFIQQTSDEMSFKQFFFFDKFEEMS